MPSACSIADRIFASRSAADFAGSQTFISRSRTLSGVFAISVSSLNSAKFLYPNNSARSWRNIRISWAMARLSCSPPFAPRASHARFAISRKSRRDENCKNGAIRDRDVVMTGPFTPFSLPALLAASIKKSGRPSRSSSDNSMNQSRSSAKTFCVNVVQRTDSRDLISVRRASASPVSAAPERTNPRY